MMKKPDLLLNAILRLLRSERERDKLAVNLRAFTKEDAAKNLAEIVIDVARAS